MAKLLKYDTEARESILTGVCKLEKAVASTLGPRGRTVLINDRGYVHCTKDGVTVANSITLKDPFEDMGVSVLQEAASKTNSMVGDGTTTSTVLAAAIFKNGLKHVAMGTNAVQLKSGIDKAAAKVIEYITSKAKTISTKEEIKQVAVISANGDEEIGEVIADVMAKIGNDGTIKVEDGNTTTMTSKIVDGMQFDRGYISPYFISNEKFEANLEAPFILIANKKISNIQDLLAPLQAVSKTGKPLLIIADDIEGEAIQTLVMNKLRGFKLCAVKSPSYGDNRKAILDDIAVLVGATVVSEDTGVTFASAIPGSDVLGMAKQVIVTQENTTIVDGLGNKTTIDTRVNSLRQQIKLTEDEFTLRQLKERLAKLAGGVGIIQVGAQTEAELKEKKDRVDDAFNATKAAIKGGIVAGGGAILLEAKHNIDTQTMFKGCLDSEMSGVEIFLAALEAPTRRICENAGIDASLIVSTILSDADLLSKVYTGPIQNIGYNVLTKKFTDMIDAGIIDPCLVTVSAIQNAASIAGLLLTTDCLICEDMTNVPTGQPSPQPGMM